MVRNVDLDGRSWNVTVANCPRSIDRVSLLHRDFSGLPKGTKTPKVDGNAGICFSDSISNHETVFFEDTKRTF